MGSSRIERWQGGAAVGIGPRVWLVMAVTMACAGLGLRWAVTAQAFGWERFLIYLTLVILASLMKVPAPNGEGTLSLSFPIVLLAIVQLAPVQAIALAAVAVIAQARHSSLNPGNLIRVFFKMATAMFAASVACQVYRLPMRDRAAVAPALCLAVAAYFLADSIPAALAEGWSTGQKPLALWRRHFACYLPIYMGSAVVAASVSFAGQRDGITAALFLLPVIYVLYRSYRSQQSMVTDRQRHLEETEALHLRTIEGLAMAIEAKDQNTHDHLLRVRVYVSEIGQELGLSRAEMQGLLTAAYLHDIGKLAVPEHIVNKPGKLTQEEFEKMKIHPIVGADILERMRFPYDVAPIVRSHHEAWDGSGYPDGLAGTQIPIGARILTVVDCFDALASDRPYRRAMPLDDAMTFIQGKSGQQFDPEVVTIMARLYRAMEERARAQQWDTVPLATNHAVWRGLTPGAGFAEDETDPPVRAYAAEDRAALESDEDDPRTRSLRLIAAASEEAQTLFEMGQMLGSSLSTNETISVMSSRLRRLVPFTCFAVYLRHGDSLLPQYIDGDYAAAFSKALIPIGQGVSGWVAESGKPLLNGNAATEPNYDPSRSTMAELHAALSLPLFDVDRVIFGVVTIYSPEPDIFRRDHLRVLQAVEAKFSLSLMNALRFRNAEQDASIDFITQLPNVRQFFLDMDIQLERAQRTSRDLSVLVCDLDSFKALNDRQGHLTGNLILRSISDGFRKICRSFDTVARMGGDEFVFLLPGVDGDCTRQLAAIHEVVRQASREHKLEVDVTISVGVAFYPQDGLTTEELLGTADRRMYLNKNDPAKSGGQHAEILGTVSSAA